MPTTSLLVIVSLILMLWGAVFSVLRWRMVLREAGGARARYNNPLDRRRGLLERVRIPHTGNGFAVGPVETRPSVETIRARAYLQRVLSLIGATETDAGYMLDVGKTRFLVKDRYVRRLTDWADPKCRSDITCFYSIHDGMPREEEVASILLQLKSNPALFDKWARQNGLPFKPDGREFFPGP